MTQTMQLQHVINTLKQIASLIPGTVYSVTTPDGITVSNGAANTNVKASPAAVAVPVQTALPLEAPDAVVRMTPKKNGTRVFRTRKNLNSFVTTNYTSTILAMKPGDIAELEMDAGRMKAFRSVVTYKAYKTFGKGNFSVIQDGPTKLLVEYKKHA